jgi:neutral ceramidase
MTLLAGTAVRDLTPQKPLFLAGYPHVPRISEGVHDPLLASALYLGDGSQAQLFIAADALFISAATTAVCRAAIHEATGIPQVSILISATHTHSAPITSSILAWRDDPVVPPPDPDYLEYFHRNIIATGVAAFEGAEPARLAITSAQADGVGCNRLDSGGPFDSEVGLLAVQRQRDRKLAGLLLIYGMHPTVLHEDSRLVSADFPCFTREQLRKTHPHLITVYHAGPCGNLSPRYHVKSQTFAEAEKLGRRLGDSVLRALEKLGDNDFTQTPPLVSAQTRAELPPNSFLPVAEAEAKLRQARSDYETLKLGNAPHGPIRTAECAVFGCEEALTLARAQASGELRQWQQRFQRAEVQVFRIGDAFIVAWPGEQFVEYALELKRAAGKRTFAISLANGELQGYIVTPEAAAAGGYEAAFALFRPEAGQRLVNASLSLIKEMS